MREDLSRGDVLSHAPVPTSLDAPNTWSTVTGREATLVAIAFAALALWRVSDAFARPGYSLSQPWGDGIGGMGWFFDHAQRFAHSGLKTALWEVYKSPDIAGGLHPPLVTTTFWRAQYWVLAKFLSIDNVYDFLGWSGFTLNGLFSYLVAREIGCSALSAFLVGLGMVSLEVFDTRVGGHLHLAFFFYQLIACWMTIRAGKRPTVPRMMASGAGLWFGFLGNEYYGYFAFFFCVMLFFGYRFLSTRVSVRRLFHGLVGGATVFVALMAVSYPRMILGRVLQSWGLVKERLPSFAQPDTDFSVYGLAHVVTIFRPSLPWLREALHPFPPDTGEFTFRLGTIAPAFASGLLVVLITLYVLGPSQQRKRVLQQCAVWSAATLLLLLFARSPNHLLSLVPLTHKIAPMFRVGVRAVLFVDLGALFILGLLFDHFLRMELLWWRGWTRRSFSSKRTAVAAIFFAVFWVGIEDLRPVNAGVFSKAPVFAVPHDAIYDHLKALPDGHVLELPFYINPPDNPETDYAYVANRMFHHKPVLNYMRDPRVQCQAIRFARDVNHPRTETAALLRELGVRYLVVHTSGDQRYDLAAYTHDPELAQIARNGPVALIEVKNSGVWSTDRFLAHYDSCVFEGGLMPTAVDSYAIFDPARQTTDRVATFSSIPNGNFLTFGPYVNLEPGRYEVAFNVRASVEKTDVRGLVMGLEVFSGSLGMIAEGEVTREQLADGKFHPVVLLFTLPRAATTEFRVKAQAQGTLAVGAITVRHLDNWP